MTSSDQREKVNGRNPKDFVIFMKNQFTAIIQKEEDWWIGWIEEVSGVNAQERTKEKLIESLKEALIDIIELNREEARREAVGDYEEVSIVA